MRCAKYVVLLAALALLVPLSAFAQSKSARNVVILDTVQVGSTQLKPGTYKVEWQGTGPLLSVSFLQHGKTVATTQGKIVEAKTPWVDDGVVTKNTGNTLTVEEIDFGGRTESLVLVSDQADVK
jgi:hypothetical protein